MSSVWEAGLVGDHVAVRVTRTESSPTTTSASLSFFAMITGDAANSSRFVTFCQSVTRLPGAVVLARAPSPLGAGADDVHPATKSVKSRNEARTGRMADQGVSITVSLQFQSSTQITMSTGTDPN
jgi:hypothetical protein